MTSENPVEALVALAHGPLDRGLPRGLPPTRLGDELRDLLQRKNGFTAFDSALVVRPAGEGGGGLAAWNARDGWRATYGDLASGMFFFAQDVFGYQHAFRDDGVVEFDPETGEIQPIARTLTEWAEWLVDDVDVNVGWSVARAWAERHGPLGVAERLVPVVPFVLGGAYDLDNLRLMDEETSMRARGGLARQIAHVPDGSTLRIQVTD